METQTSDLTILKNFVAPVTFRKIRDLSENEAHVYVAKFTNSDFYIHDYTKSNEGYELIVKQKYRVVDHVTTKTFATQEELHKGIAKAIATLL